MKMTVESGMALQKQDFVYIGLLLSIFWLVVWAFQNVKLLKCESADCGILVLFLRFIMSLF